MSINAFAGTGNNVAIAATTSSGSAALPGNTEVPGSIRVYNSGTTGVAFVRWGASAPTAVATDTFVAPGSTEVFSIPPGVTHVAAILSASTGNVYFQRGGGL